MRTFTEADDHVVREVVTPWPSGNEDSVVTAPFVRALELEGPTTIFDRVPERTTVPARGSWIERGSRIDRAATEDELDDSYEAALKKFV